MVLGYTDGTMNTVTLQKRAPVVVVVGHVDHGKSTLLDTIHKKDIVEGEFGGITQNISAYEVSHTSKEYGSKKLTFLDTPGHESFQHMRLCGAEIADIAILIVSAEDGVKKQTREAIGVIKDARIPFIVAINKIDSHKADVERTKYSLLESEVLLEGLGGDTPYALISAKKGTGIEEMLDLLLLVAECENFDGDPHLPASGYVIESHISLGVGRSIDMVIKNGNLSVGDYIVVDGCCTKIRAIKNDQGASIQSAQFSSPITVGGFDCNPIPGSVFNVFKTKEQADKKVKQEVIEKKNKEGNGKDIQSTNDEIISITCIAKAKTIGLLHALTNQLQTQVFDRAVLNIIDEGIGMINESDLRRVKQDPHPLVIGFQSGIDSIVINHPDLSEIPHASFDVIYDLIKWVNTKVETYTKGKFGSISGTGEVIALFSYQKGVQLCGMTLLTGSVTVKQNIRAWRDGEVCGEGRIVSLQKKNTSVTTTNTQNANVGMKINIPRELQIGDKLEFYT